MIFTGFAGHGLDAEGSNNAEILKFVNYFLDTEYSNKFDTMRAVAAEDPIGDGAHLSFDSADGRKKTCALLKKMGNKKVEISLEGKVNKVSLKKECGFFNE